MTRYLAALWDDSDPTYAPGLKVVRGVLYWRPTKRCVDMGFPSSAVRLPGSDGDGRDLERAALCRDHTKAMLAATRGAEDQPRSGTWQWVMDRWRQDRYGAFQNCHQNTRYQYDWCLKFWSAQIGRRMVSDMTYERVCEIRSSMERDGQSAAFIRRHFGILGALARYAKGPLRHDPARHVVDVLSMMRFKAAPKRQVAPTSDQVLAIVREADARGLHGFATGVLIQWTYMLRSVDVRGQWLSAAPGEGGVIRGGLRWQDGLTWDMFNDDLTLFRKVIAKTRRSMPAPLTFEITPLLRSRLSHARLTNQIGPVILSEQSGLPYTRSGWAKAWSRIRDDLGLPKEITSMDTRAGGITEAKALGADPMSLRDAAQHLRVDTTDGYARGRDEGISRVVRLRHGNVS